MPDVSPEPESKPTEPIESAEPTGSAADPSEEPAAPLNRAERRAQRRGKKPPLPTAGQSGPVDRRKPVVVQRRSGRRGNR